MGVRGSWQCLLMSLGRAFGFLNSELPPSKVDPCPACKTTKPTVFYGLTIQALTAVFGMEANGKIKKDRVRVIVEKLGLTGGEENSPNCPDPCNGLKEEVDAEDVIGGLEDASGRSELLHQAFKIFDEDGNGFIEAVLLKRVLECLGLDGGWNIGDIEKMVQVVDLNLDGKVDLSEFKLMMAL
ncbi:calmodulin-like protein 6 [Rhodamnia argentea]|uniref:Calmodulin-like protein 6 n=1 Tax=Rhodamnia argentea TaxID=178133 RepID=A0A8B8QE81_9MYRT|nr:calmodulin-like protein 6 [Rhodamnia argentea]